MVIILVALLLDSVFDILLISDAVISEAGSVKSQVLLRW